MSRSKHMETEMIGALKQMKAGPRRDIQPSAILAL